MFESVKNTLITWNASKDGRQKLQHAYVVIALAAVLVAGVVSLFNANAGHNIVFVALGAVVVFMINAFIWNLLQSSVVAKLPKTTRRK